MAEALKSMLLPLEWVGQYVPLLPDSMLMMTGMDHSLLPAVPAILLPAAPVSSTSSILPADLMLMCQTSQELYCSGCLLQASRTRWWWPASWSAIGRRRS